MWLLFQSGQYVTPYPFNSQRITSQAYVDYLMTRVFYAITVLAIKILVDTSAPEYSKEMTFVLWFFVLYILDYMLFYNQPVARIRLWGLDIPVSYSLFMGVGLIVVSLESVIKWSFYK